MEKKLLILLMSCNDDLYEKEEQACRDTFLKTAEELNIPYWFYKGSKEEGPSIDKEKHVLYLDTDDTLSGTAKKTIEALNTTLDQDYDYLIKTNVSTYLNIPQIISATSCWEGKDDPHIYGARYIVNKFSLDVPFPRGHFVIYPKNIVEGIMSYAPLLAGKQGMPYTDDTLLGLSTLYYINKVLGNDYLQSLMEVPAVNEWNANIQDAPEFPQALSIRCKGKNKEQTPDNMRATDSIIRSTNKTNMYRRPPRLFETGAGMLNYETYCKVREKEKENS